MSDMLNYSLGILQGITTMLASPPLIYIIGFLLLVIVGKVFLLFLPRY